MSRFVKILLAIIIIPAAFGLTGILISYLRGFSSSYLPFLLGFASYTLTYPVFRKPLTSYVIGHELTHILGVWFSRGKIHSVKIGRYGGTIKADKINLWTALLPYIFPIYTVLVLGIYFILSILWNMSRYYNWMVFILGITWAFHFWMTLYVLRLNQPDVRYGGFLFSMITIFTINILILALLLVFVSPGLVVREFIMQSFERIRECYNVVLRMILRLIV